LPKGQAAATALREQVPPMQWYVRQAEAIGLIPEAVSGGLMRRRQYEHPGYEAAVNGRLIPEITEEVTKRAEDVAGRFGLVWPPDSSQDVADGGPQT
jgi:hypothetical protein